MYYFSEKELQRLKKITNFDIFKKEKFVKGIQSIFGKNVKLNENVLVKTNFQEALKIINLQDEQTHCIYKKLEGTIKGDFYLFITEKECNNLTKGLLKNVEEEEEMKISFLLEYGNILSSLYFSNISNLVSSELHKNTPFYTKDFPEAFLDYNFIEYAQFGDEIVLFTTRLKEKNEETVQKLGTIVFLFEPLSLLQFQEKEGEK